MQLYVVNADTFGNSRYLGEVPRGLAVIDNETLLALSGTHLTAQSPDSTEEVAASLETGQLTLAANQEFNVPKVSFATEGEITIQVGRKTSEYGVPQEWDTYATQGMSALFQHELMLETRQRARSYTFKITTSQPGARLETFDAYVNPVRHRRGR